MKTIFYASALALLAVAPAAQAAPILGDTLLGAFDSGVGPLPGPYGGDTLGSGFPIALPDYGNALDGVAGTFVSLPRASFIEIGFSMGPVIDSAGDDLFVSENGGNSEQAWVLVSNDGGLNFSFLGTALGGAITGFDIGGLFPSIDAVRILALDNGGASPGFDLAYVEGNGAPIVPLPAGLPLVATGLAAFGLIRQRKQS